MAKTKKFKALEKNAKNTPLGDIEELKWEGEELMAESKTKVTDDVGYGHPVVLRFFDFGANPEAFKLHKPTAQELFNSHIGGIESLLWRDGLKIFPEVEPRLMFSKDKKHYRFVIPCIPMKGQVLNDKPQTLSELLANAPK